ncbi:MAG TPA: phospholipase [Planctomycetaceae bacterium]|nr:phospholipase [Planctomycetaceae bacterium]HRF02699.1 lysophospholipase [Pirellulaceae bacterium]
MNVSRQRYGSLDAAVVDAKVTDAPIDLVAVLMHGYGAPGDDLVPLADELLRRWTPRGNVRLIFPAAPLSLASLGMPGGRAWWHLSIQSLLDAFAAGEHHRLKAFDPPGIDEARDAIDRACAAALDEAGLDRSRLVLGGFSQGAMLATETALHRGDAIGGLVLWSGTLIRESIWRPAAERAAKLRIYQSHGSYDPILPFVTATWLRDLLTETGHDLTFAPFAGPHTITADGLAGLGTLLDRALERSSA